MNDGLPTINFTGRYVTTGLYLTSFAVLVGQGFWLNNGWFIFAGALGIFAAILDALAARNDQAKDRVLREHIGAQADHIDRLDAELGRTRRIYHGEPE